MNFIHMADMHLGYKQYDLDQRFKDLGLTFKQIIQYAIANKVEFVLIAGDLFDKRSINAPTYIQAVHVLSLLKDAGIPCIAIEGNHDRRFIKDGMSWLESLEWEGLLQVIKNGNGSLMGDYRDVGDTRIFGLGFSGSMTSAAIPQMVSEIKEINVKAPPKKTILMMHAGVQGKMKQGIIGEVTYEELYPLKEVVDYLALGHYHNAYEIDGWVYNPGSPDTCSIAECADPKGFYHVIDGRAELKQATTRKFIIINVNVDGLKTADALFNDVKEKLAGNGKCDGPVVNILLEGTLGFDQSHLNLESIKGLVNERLGAIHVDVRFNLLNDEFYISKLDSNELDRTAIEREVFRRLARSDSMLADNSESFAASIAEVKDMAVKGADEKTLDAILRRIYEQARCGTPAVPPMPVTTSTVEEPASPAPAIKVNPAKKPRKKATIKGQAALDVGDGQ